MTGRSVTTAMVAMAGLFLPLPALAQSYQCSVPQRLAPIRPVVPDGPPRRAGIGGYLLAASWSPEHCKTARDTRSMQCSHASGRFGFILHGLWPEGAGGLSPQWCAKGPPPPVETLRPYLCMSPSPDLMAHEWAKHGSCMVRTPEKYFRVASILWRSIRWPDADRLSRKQGLTAGDLRTEFLAANRGWRRESVGIEIGRSGWLRELHLCYDKGFRPTRCTRSQFGPADPVPLKIWRGL